MPAKSNRRYLFSAIQNLNGRFCVFNKQVLNGFQFPETVHLAYHLITGAFKDALSGALFLTGHVVIGVVSGVDHHWLQKHTFVIPGLHRGQNLIHGGGSLHGADEIIGSSAACQFLLHSFVYFVGSCLRAMAHQADGGCSIVIGGGGCSQGIGSDPGILVRGQQWGTDGEGSKSTLIPGGFLDQF